MFNKRLYKLSCPLIIIFLAFGFLLVVNKSSCQSHSLDFYGGSKSIQLEATGFFQVSKIADRWVLVTPEGHPYLAIGANHTGKFLTQPAQSGPMLDQFQGSTQAAQKYLLKTYKDLGFNAGEAYAPHDPYLKKHLPYVAHITYPTQSHFEMDIFDPQVQDSIYKSTFQQCQKISNDPMVIGIAFKDLPIWDSRRVDYFRSLPKEAPGKQVYIQFLQKKYHGKIDQFNKVYQKQINHINDLFGERHWVKTNDMIEEDDAYFMAEIAENLYSVLKNAVRKAAPNHLFFGERYQLRAVPDPVLKVVGNHVDVFLTQALIRSPQRPPEWQIFQREGYDHEFKIVKKPMIIIDWATPFSLDKTFKNKHGTIKNEKLATRDNRNWLAEALQTPYIVGVFKCQLIGTHGNDRWFDGKAKRTVVKDDGSYFDHMSKGMREAHKHIITSCYNQLSL